MDIDSIYSNYVYNWRVESIFMKMSFAQNVGSDKFSFTGTVFVIFWYLFKTTFD